MWRDELDPLFYGTPALLAERDHTLAFLNLNPERLYPSQEQLLVRLVEIEAELTRRGHDL